MFRLPLNRRAFAIALSGAAALCTPAAEGAYTLDRWYQMGDDKLFSGTANAENAANGIEVGSGSTAGLGQITYDSVATDNFTFQALNAFGATGLPVYTEYGVSGAPAGPVAGAASMNRFGVLFDGVDDYLSAVSLNDPSVTAPGSTVSYSTSDRGMQLWVYPNAIDGTAEYVIDDADQHGFNITNLGEWIAETRDDRIITGVGVAQDRWTHVMLTHDSVGLGGSVMYVNGVAISSQTTGYNASSPANLLVGANSEVDTGQTQDPNLQAPPTFYSGIIDEIELFVIDDGSAYGRFDYTHDNGYFTDVFLPAQSGYGFTLDTNTGHNAQQWVDGDIDFDGDFDQTDINLFVSGWLSASADLPGNGPQAGDYLTLGLGDLTLDGRTGVDDWVRLRTLVNASNANLLMPTAAQLMGVPSPAGISLAASAVALLGIGRRRSAS